MKIITLVLFLCLSFQLFSQECKTFIVGGLSKLNEADFIHCVSDTFKTSDISTEYFNSLKLITGIQSFNFEGESGRCYCNRTFSNKFNTYILCYPPFVDSDIKLYLINCREDTIYSQIDLSVNSEHELGKGSCYSIFVNDSVFVKYLDYKKIDFIDGVIDNEHWYIGKIITTYLIKSDGKIIVIDEKKDERKERINY